MASASDIELVRLNTDEPGTDHYSDDDIGEMVDASSVAGASALVWEQKAARFASLVNVTEAGASHSFSDLYKSASAQAAYWRKRRTDEEATAGVVVGARPRTSKIVRP